MLISNTLDYIEKHLSAQLTLKRLASVACMSPSYFHRTFKKETNRTPFEFIEEIKMNIAYNRLISNKVKVYELTEELGYNDYETFTRAFKKHHALAPDDLNTIALKIHSEMEVGPDGLIIKTFKVDEIDEIKKSLEGIVDQLKELLKERGYSQKDIKKAKVMSVMPKLDDFKKEQNVVKNKYVIPENQKIWKALLDIK